MPLSADQIAALRSEIGDSEPPDDDDLYDIYLRRGSITGTAIEVTRKRIATLASGGALNFSVPGEYSENRGDNLRALETILKRLQTEGIEGDAEYARAGAVTVSSVRRYFPR
jgi:hypothetical protein